MNSKNYQLIKRLKKTTVQNSFFQEVKTFFEDQYSEMHCDIIKAIPFNPFYIFLTHLDKNSSLKNDLFEFNNIDVNGDFLKVNKYNIYKLDNENKNEIILFVFEDLNVKNQNDIKQTCEIINDLYTLARQNFNTSWNESTLLNANLISQISHDINSMITLLNSGNNKFENRTNKKIRYTEKMAGDVLQYVRDIELLGSDVIINDLLNGILNNIEIPEQIKLVKDFKVGDESIEVDVELINQAIKELMLNSINALENTSGSLTIFAKIYKSSNIFFQRNYLQVCLKDSGPGINPDFLEFLKNPFFTTRKTQYHSGLGLSIANKIIEAHSGHLDIQLNENTNPVVTIYLPLQRKNNV